MLDYADMTTVAIDHSQWHRLLGQQPLLDVVGKNGAGAFTEYLNIGITSVPDIRD